MGEPIKPRAPAKERAPEASDLDVEIANRANELLDLCVALHQDHRSEETFTECRACMAWETHEEHCFVPALDLVAEREADHGGVLMPTICISCSMKALVDGTTPPVFEETPEEHMARVHPNPLETYRERQMLTDALTKRADAWTARPEGEAEVDPPPEYCYVCNWVLIPGERNCLHCGAKRKEK